MSQFLKKWSEAKSDQEKDGVIGEGINQVLDMDLRDRWHTLLMNENDQNPIEDRSTKNRRLLLWRGLAIAATIAILIMAGRFLFVSPDLAQQAHDFLQESMISHPGVTKGLGEEQVVQRSEAIASYAKGNFQLAANQFARLDSKSTEDLFFQAVANLYAENYQIAINQFNDIRKDNTTLFREEINWYRALALLVEGREEEATIVLESIKATEWHGQEAAKILSQLRH